jgi:triacylglycerol lipase
VFQAPDAGGPARPVLIYVAGGQGDKVEQFSNGDAFYDNIMLWAVKNGMVGVNVMRQSGPGTAWDANAKDVAAAVAWVKANIARYGGDPDRVFIWSHSAGNTGVTTYLAHKEYQPAGGPGLKGAILMSGNVNVAPIRIAPQPNSFAAGFGPPPRPQGAPPPPRPDPAVQLARSNLPGLKATKVPLFLAAAELDPTDRVEFVKTVGDELCKAGTCPDRLVVPDHDHMSIVFAINTADTSASAPILAWLRKHEGR